MLELVQAVEDHARALAARRCEEAAVGLFSVVLDPDLPYAVPRGDEADSRALAAAVGEALAFFAERGLAPRFEVLALRRSSLPAVLESRGLVLESALPICILQRDRFAPRAEAAVDIRAVDAAGDLAFVASLVRQGFDVHAGPPSPADAEALREALAAGLRGALAWREGLPAGSAFSAPEGGVTELSMVSVLPSQRRRGVARTLVSFLAAEHFAAGGKLAWAGAESAAAFALLTGLGFEDAGPRLVYTTP